ncbi:nidogen-like [Episyrphus balteatus]|uniref:nidogen-like n=1 Tax=Episyrphus balteatus TaxID=286459 RepID=UPI00248652AB|nr:nidogen-like [Episyrphus balteatus]
MWRSCFINRASFECICNPGFYSSDNNRNVCEKENCQKNPSLCHLNANCHSINGTNTCVCKTGYHGNGTTCIKTEFLLSVEFNGIQRIFFDGKLKTVVELINYGLQFDIDCIEGRVYYYKFRKILSAFYDGTDSRSFITEEDISDLQGLAIDSISRLVYWHSYKKSAIEVASLNNPMMRTVLVADESLRFLRNIAVDPIRGKLYWILNNRFSSKIEMSELDGTAREILFTLPSGLDAQTLAVLPNSGDLCFNCYDRKQGSKLMCIDFHSKEVRNITVTSLRIDRITATNDSIYWYDGGSKTIEGIDSDGRRHPSVHCEPGGYVNKLIALENYCPQGINPCQMNNGECPVKTKTVVETHKKAASQPIIPKPPTTIEMTNARIRRQVAEEAWRNRQRNAPLPQNLPPVLTAVSAAISSAASGGIMLPPRANAKINPAEYKCKWLRNP